MNLNQIFDQLNDFADKNELATQAVESCWTCIRNLLNEGGSDADILLKWGPENFVVRLDKQSFVFEHIWGTAPFIDTQVGLYVRDESGTWLDACIPLGVYNFETNLNGECRDEWFVLRPLIHPDDD